MKAQRNDGLRIDSVRLDTGGEIGMTLCPGKKQRGAMSGDWNRDLADDLGVIAGWGASSVVSVILPEELTALGVHNIGAQINARASNGTTCWCPTAAFAITRSNSLWLRPDSNCDARSVAETRSSSTGLGRTGMLAARVLVEVGESPEEAILRARDARRTTIETFEHERDVFTWRKLKE